MKTACRAAIWLAAIFVILVVPVRAFGATAYTWVGGTGNWSTTTNWSPNGVPGSASGDSVDISAAGTYTVTFDVNLSFALTTVAVGNCASCAPTLAIPSGRTLNVSTGTIIGSASFLTNAQLLINGGTFTGTGSLIVEDTASLTWPAGTISGSGTVQVMTGATVTMTNTNWTYLDTRAFLNGGIFNYTPNATYYWSLYNGGSLNNTGTFSILGDNIIWYSGSTSITNSGTFQKSGGTGTASIGNGISLTNTGTLAVSNGQLQLSGGGSSSGTINITTGNKLAISSSTFTLTGGSVTGTGDLRVDGGTLTASTNITVPVLNFVSGTVNGASPNVLTVTNMSWSGGTMGGTGKTAVSSTLSMNNTTSTYLDVRTLENNGVINYAPTAGTLNLYNGASLINNGTVNILADGSWFASGTNTVTNAGTFTKSSGAGSFTFSSGVVFNTSGTLSVSSGSVIFNSGGTATGGTWDIGAASTIDIPASTYTFSAAPVFSNSGALRVNGGTLTVSAAAASVPKMTFSSGNINGSGTLTIADLTWNGGTMGGSGTTVLSTTAAITNTTYTYVDTRTLTNNGTVNYTANSWGLWLYNGATFNNNGTFSFLDNGVIGYSGTNTINNNGTIQKTGGTGSSEIQSGIILNNTATGTLKVTSGTLTLRSTTNNSGTIDIAAANRIDLPSGTHTFTAANFAGTGPLRVNGGTLTISGNVTIPNLEFTTGTINGSAPNVLTVNALSWSAGTMSGTGTTEVAPGGTATMTSANWTYLDGRTFTNKGTFNYTPGSWGFYLYNGATFNNQSLFDALGDGVIGHSGTNTFNNSGTFQKSGGTGTLTLNAGIVFNNTGTLAASANQGFIALTGGGASTGIFDAGANAAVDISGGTYTLNAGATVTGAGFLAVKTGGTLNVNAAISVPNLFLTNTGTITGTGTLTLTGASSKWGGGTMNNAAGTTVVDTGATLTIDNSGSNNAYLDGRTLTNLGTIVYNNPAASTYLYQYNSSIINNSGTFTVTADAQLFGSPGTFNNSGTFQKTSGSGTTTVSAAFHNTGTVSVTSGSVTFNANGTHTGAFTAAAGKTITFGGGTHAFNNGSQLDGGGTIAFTGGTSTFSSTTCAISPTPCLSPTNLSLSNSGLVIINAAGEAANFTLMNSGTLSGTATFSINSSGTWGGGYMSGPGTTVIAAAATLTINNTGSNYPYIDQRTVNNQGTINYTIPASSYYLYFQNNGVLNNNGTFNATSDGPIHWAGTGVFNNIGTFQKTGGTGTTIVGVAFHNSGTVTASSGTLAFNINGTHTGPFYATTGALSFTGGTHAFNTGSEISGAGAVFVSSGTLNVSSASCPGSPNPCFDVNALTISGGTLNLNIAGEANTLALTGSGVLGGTGTFTINTSGTWTGGYMSGSGTTVIPSGVTLALSAGTNYQYIDGRTINNAGTMTYSTPASSYYIYFQNSGVLNNSGTFTVTGDAVFGSNGTGAFNNSGTFQKTAGTGITDISVAFNNTGSVIAGSGTLSLNSNGTHTGPFTVSAAFKVASGTNTFNNGSQIAGAGSMSMTNGTVHFNSAACPNAPQPCFDVNALTISGGTLNVNAAGETNTLALSGFGSLGGTGTFTINTSGTWTGGYMAGTGTTVIPIGATLALSAGTNYQYVDARTINNAGTITYATPAASYYIYFQNSSVLNNSGTFTVTGAAQIGTNGTGAFNNSGTFQKTAGSQTDVNVAFNNTGTAGVTSGNLLFNGGGTHAGAFTAAASTQLGFTGGTHTIGAGSSVTGAGIVVFLNGTTHFNAATCGTPPCFDVTETRIISGTANFNAAARTDAFTLSGSGTLGGSGTFTINGTGTWGGGTMGGSGTTVLGSSAVLTLDNSGGNYQNLTDSRALNNGGTINYTTPAASYYLNLYNTSVINNSGTFDLQNDAIIGGGTTIGIINTGTLKKSAGSATSNIYTPVNNTGTVLVESGTLYFNGSFNQTGGFVTLAGGTLDATSTITIAGGALTGNGTVDMSVVNNSQVNPGNSAGLITINGNYTQGSGAQMNVELGGLAAGAQYDRLAVTGLVTLNGTLNVSLINPFTPATGNTFSVLTFGTRSGDFAVKNMPVLGGGSSLNPTYTATSLDLVTNTVQADIAVSQNITPAGISSGQPYNYIVTVTNNGGSNATNVVLTDTLPGGVTVNSITPAQGSCGGSGTITCNLGALASLASTTVTFNVTAPVAGSYTNTASAAASEFDPNNGNDTNIQAVAVVGSTASLSLSINDAPDPVNAGGNITYTVTVTNAGPDPATSVSFSDSIGAGGTILSASGAGWSCGNTATTANCTLPSLGIGSSTITIVAQASASATSIGNSGSVTASNASTANASATTAVTPIADVAVSVSGPVSASAGGSVTFTISVTNNGPSTAQTLSVSYPTPAGVSFTSATGACNTASSCSIAGLAPAATVAINVTYSIPPGGTGTITQNASVTAATTDPAAGNNSASASTAIAEQADLAVSVTGAPSVNAGETTTFTVSVTNNGPSTAQTISLSYPTPAGASFVSASGACITAATCAIATLAPSATATVSVTYAIAASASGSVTQNASVTAATADAAAGNNSASATTAVAQQADLAVAVSGPPVTSAGGNVTFTISVTNNGPSSAQPVSVSFPTPAGLTFVSSGGACTGGTPCSIAALAPSSTATFTVTYSIPSGATGTITQTASVTSPATDPVGANNNASATTTISEAADVAVSVSGPVSTNAGGSVTFTISVTNNGPSAAQTLSVSYPTPAGVSFSSASGACNTASTCAIASLAPSSTVAINVTYAVPAGGTGTITQNASVTAATADPAAGNNSASASAAIAQQADLAISIAGPPSAVAGQTITYTITVTNNGPSNVASISVADPTPAGTTFQLNTGACTTPFPCAIGTLSSGQSATITSTFAVGAGFPGSSLTNAVSVSSPAASDPAPANDSAQSVATVAHNADVAITITAPPSAGSTVAFTVTVTNNGPSDATAVNVTSTPSAGLSFTSNTGGCTTPYPCALGTLTPGQTVTFTSNYNTTGSGTLTNTVDVVTSAADGTSANNSASASSVLSACPQTPANLAPADNATNVATAGTLTWTADPIATSYDVYLSAGTGCSPLFFGNTTTNSIHYNNLVPGTQYTWRVEAKRTGCPFPSTPCLHFTTAANCPAAGAVPAAPANGSVVSGAVTFTWTAAAGAAGYQLTINPPDGAAPIVVNTTATSHSANLGAGAHTWSVAALFPGTCPPIVSAPLGFIVCHPAPQPLAAVVADVQSGAAYDLSWNALEGVTRYEVQEDRDAAFNSATTDVVTGTSREFRHTVDQATPFFYRVRGIADCSNVPGPWSDTVRTIVKNPPPPAQKEAKDLVVPVGSTDVVEQQIFVPGFPPDSYAFTARVDKPWMSVIPATGILGPAGQIFTIRIDPAGQPNGTITGTLIVDLAETTTASALGPKPAGNPPPVSVPVSVNLVTPVSSVPKSGPQPVSMFIPAVAHADGVDSKWQSDVRITNTGATTQKVQLFFTPSGSGVTAAKTTSINVEAGATVALDDIVKHWFGSGVLGDGATGVLEIRPPSAGILASSRTYNTTAAGTLGQYVPAVPFASFIGRGASLLSTPMLSMQQVAQSSAFRTNFGILEAAGLPVTALVRVFDGGGNKLKEMQMVLTAGEHKQVNSFLAQNDITLTDGRIEVVPFSGSGKLMAYASVVDNESGAPMLVTGSKVGANSTTRQAIPGVIDHPVWRTDLRIFNPTNAMQPATLTFVPMGDPANTKSVDVVIAPNEVKAFDGVVANTFDLHGKGGAIQVSTGIDTPLMVSARTYAQTEDGTYGQFIPAVAAKDAVGLNEKPLNILQIESSVRYRSNIGLVEVTGKPVTALVTLVPPDSKIAANVEVSLEPNEFLQLPLAGFDSGTIYNARVIVRVTGGQGRVAAYGSVVDMQTQAPTYIPAQQ